MKISSLLMIATLLGFSNLLGSVAFASESATAISVEYQKLSELVTSSEAATCGLGQGPLTTTAGVNGVLSCLGKQNNKSVAIDFEGATVVWDGTSIKLEGASELTLKVKNLNISCQTDHLPGIEFALPSKATYSINVAKPGSFLLRPVFDLSEGNYKKLLFDNISIEGSLHCDGFILMGNYKQATFQSIFARNLSRFTIGDLKEGGGTMLVKNSRFRQNVKPFISVPNPDPTQNPKLIFQWVSIGVASNAHRTTLANSIVVGNRIGFFSTSPTNIVHGNHICQGNGKGEAPINEDGSVGAYAGSFFSALIQIQNSLQINSIIDSNYMDNGYLKWVGNKSLEGLRISNNFWLVTALPKENNPNFKVSDPIVYVRLEYSGENSWHSLKNFRMFSNVMTLPLDSTDAENRTGDGRNIFHIRAQTTDTSASTLVKSFSDVLIHANIQKFFAPFTVSNQFSVIMGENPVRYTSAVTSATTHHRFSLDRQSLGCQPQSLSSIVPYLNLPTIITSSSLSRSQKTAFIKTSDAVTGNFDFEINCNQ